MTIPRQVIRQRDFSAGEINPDAVRRDDADMFASSVRHARNLQSLKVGGLERRQGREWLYNDEGVRDEFQPFPGVIYSLTFAAGRVTIRNPDGAIVVTLGAPWSAAAVDLLVWAAFDNLVIVTGPGFRPQVIEVDKATLAWSIRAYDFETGIAGKVLAPFYRFGAKGATLQPGGRSGSITLTASEAVFDPQHLGTVFRYAGKQMRITAVGSPTFAIAMVIETLQPTWRITTSTDAGLGAGYTVGELVASDTSGWEGEIVAVDGNTIDAVSLTKGSSLRVGETLVSPSASSEVTSLLEIAPGPTVQWDEIFMSDYRGWPQSVTNDVQRTIFTNFPQFKQAVAWGALNQPFNFNVSGDAADAIVEYIQQECRVLHVVGGYDQFAITDIGVFYIPISSSSPLVPGSVEFRIIFAGEVADVRPIQVTEGVLFVDRSRTGIYAITATGQTARPYIASEITEYHRHLFDGIRSIAASSGTPTAAARQIFAINEDGTVVIGQYNAERSYVGWLKWDGAGSVRAVSSRYGAVVFSTSYAVNGATIAVAERMDEAMPFDCCISAGSGDFTDVLILADGNPLALSSGESLTLSRLVMDFLAGGTVQVMADGFFLGDVAVGADGAIEIGTFEAVIVGFNFEWLLQPNIGGFEGGESFGQRLRRRKIGKVMMTVRETQEFRCGNRRFAGYVGGDDTALPMPKRSATYVHRQQGRSHDPSYDLAQTFPGSFKLLELTTEVTV